MNAQFIAKNKNYIADAGLLLTAIMWGGGFAVTKNALDHITPLMMMAIRFVLAFIILAMVFRKRLITISKKDLWGGCIIGVFLFLGFSSQTIGLVYTTASKNAFITGTNVVIVPFLVMAVTKKFPGWHAMIAAVMTVVGLSFLTIEDGVLSTINIGDWLTLACAFFYACQVVTIGMLAPRGDAIALSVVQIGACALLCLIAGLIFEPIPVGMSTQAWGAIAYLVMLSTILCFVIQNVAQKYTPSSHAALILSLEGVFGAFFAFIFLGELFTRQMLLGCALIFVAVIISETRPGLNKLFSGFKDNQPSGPSQRSVP
ncbi:MAG: DMT family transporter [Bacillota bacterium]